MISDSDLLYLRLAMELAEEGLYTTTPNPRVGCVIVRDGRVLGRGWHQWYGQAHAEVNAMAAAGGDVAGATAYVSLEPCSIDSQTPPCCDALIDAKIARVVVAMVDLDPRVNGAGLARLVKAGLSVENADLEEARAVNPGHRQRMLHGRPLIRVKIAGSLDGRSAMASGESQWITGPEARADGQAWRARSCAVVTGIGTVLADDPELNVRDDRFRVDGRFRQPLRVVVDSKLRTPIDARLFDREGDVLLVHAQAGGQHARAECVACGSGSVDLAALVEELTRRRCNEVLIEAGPTLSGAFIQQELWDEAIVYLAPKLLGSTARSLVDVEIERLQDALQGRVVDCVSIGDDLRVRLIP